MEITEVLDRILRAHWKLIVAFVLAGIVAGFSIHVTDGPSYTATARVLLDTETPEPTSETEARAIADTARAIVTSPSVVERALDEAGISRSASLMVLEEQISVSTVGSSGIIEVAVTDRDAGASARLANLLAEDLIATRLKSTRGTLDDALAEIQDRIPRMEASLEELDAQIAAASDSTQERLSRDREPLAQRLVILEEKRAGLLSTLAERPTPQIIDPARRALEADPSQQPVDLALGGLLGLILGISLSVVLESFRPTVVGGPAVSRELDAPVLGLLSNPPDRNEPDEIAPVAAWLSTAAESAGVRTVALMGTSHRDGLENLAADLSKYANGANPLDIRAMGLPVRGNGGRQRTTSTSAGIVVVTPVVARKSDLIAVRDLFGMTGRRVLGAIAYRESKVQKIFRLTGRQLFGAGTGKGPGPRRSRRRRKVSNR
jgi:capsular polysaccharide biosynthesis protein